jgi:hypothetical protein
MYLHTYIMSSLLQALGRIHRTDKCQHTFKGKTYCDIYDKYLIDMRMNVKKFVEIGIKSGASLKMWEEYFPNATIYGIDIDPSCKKYEGGRIKCFIGDQNDEDFLLEMKEKIGKYDVLVDDGSHITEHQIKSFNILYENCDENGIYIIEDLRNSYEEFCNHHDLRTIWPGMKYNKENDELKNYRKDLNEFFQDKVKQLDFHSSDKLYSLHHYPMIAIFKNGF